MAAKAGKFSPDDVPELKKAAEATGAAAEEQFRGRVVELEGRRGGVAQVRRRGGGGEVLASL